MASSRGIHRTSALTVSNPDHGDEGECASPPEGLADPGRHRYTDDVRHRQAHHHHRDGLGSFARFGEVRCHQCGNTEIRAVRQTGHEPGGNQLVETRREDRPEIAERERHHQRQQQHAPRNTRRKSSDGRRTDDDAERVGGDHVAGRRLRDSHRRRDVREQAHRREFGGADTEAADG
jgi:hypothetical protein